MKCVNREKKSLRGNIIESLNFSFPSSSFFSSVEKNTPNKPKHIKPAINLKVNDQPLISANIRASEVAAIIANL